MIRSGLHAKAGLWHPLLRVPSELGQAVRTPIAFGIARPLVGHLQPS